MTLRMTAGGSSLRLQLSNAQGAAPVEIGGAGIGIRTTGSAIRAGSHRNVTFEGRAATVIMPGSVIVSDPVKLEVPALTELAVSLYLPKETRAATVHPLGLNSTYVAPGNAISALEIATAQTNRSYFWLTGIEVGTLSSVGTIIAFGDSITDGFATTPDTHRAWPELLAKRLLSRPGTAQWSVINAGISGNRICREGTGWSGLARFDRDVLSRPGVKWIVLLEGINDINLSVFPGAPKLQRTSAEEIIRCLNQFIEKAHLHGIRVMGATITPTEGLWLYNSEAEAMRQTVNNYIRTSGKYDAVVDFDQAVSDPSRPSRLHPDFDPGDHVHPNDAGNGAMAGAFDLVSFERQSRSPK